MSEESDKNKYKLSRPVEFDEKTVSELNFDFESLNGRDLLTCAKQARALDAEEISPVKALSLTYQIAIAAKAAGVVPELILALKGRDFTEATQRAQNFLVTSE